MKKKIMFFLIFFVVPFVVEADSISLICNSNVVSGTSISCVLNGNSNDFVTAISAKVRTGTNISFSSFTPGTSWQGDGEEGSIDLYTASDISGDFVIGTINFNVSPIHEGGTSTITIDSVFFYDENGQEVSVNPVTKNIRLASSVNDLSSLSLSTGNLNPNFSSDITSYSTTIDASSVSVSAKVKDSNSSISGDIGKVNLNYGNNTFRVIVTSESGATKTYTVNIVRPNNNTNNNNQNNDNNQNTIVTKSNNTNLKNISLSSGSINFDKNVLEYNTNVSCDITDIEVVATTEDDKARVEISGNNNLVVGNNKIQIKVIAEDNSSKIYVINLERKKEDYVLSSNDYISSINIKDYDIDFDKNNLNYTLKIMGEKQLEIEVLLEDSKSNYEIVGNNDLKDGSVIKIIVTSEDGNVRTYNVNISSNDRYIKAIFILIIIILLIINIVRIFLKYRREKNERNAK